MSNFGLFKSLEKIGISCAKTAVGDKYVYEYMSEKGCRLGGEQSGHIIFSKYATTGDGILTSLKIMEVMLAEKKKASELSEGFVFYPQSLYHFPTPDPKAVLKDPEVLDALQKINDDLGKHGRMLLRASGTEPVIRLLTEAPSQEISESQSKKIIEILQKNKWIETSASIGS
jgi:phosphoglucosamine mutase